MRTQYPQYRLYIECPERRPSLYMSYEPFHWKIFNYVEPVCITVGQRQYLIWCNCCRFEIGVIFPLQYDDAQCIYWIDIYRGRECCMLYIKYVWWMIYLKHLYKNELRILPCVDLASTQHGHEWKPKDIQRCFSSLVCLCVDHSKATNQPKTSALWSGYDGQTRTKQQFLSLQRAVERQGFTVYPAKGVFECNVPGKTATWAVKVFVLDST